MHSVAGGDRREKAACKFCGSLIEHRPFARSGEEFCCEGCYHKQKQFRDVQAERDNAYLALAEALSSTLDAREHETGLHSRRVACHTLVLARLLTTSAETLRQVYWGSLLHDIGKTGIPDAILLKAGPLTDSEWQVMRTHPQIGSDILANVPFMADAARIVLCHEERFDGKGYPRGLAGEDIPLWARLFAVVDTLDAITSDRPYRAALPFDAAEEEIMRVSGVQFDPRAVDAFIGVEQEMRNMVALKWGRASLPPSAPPEIEL